MKTIEQPLMHIINLAKIGLQIQQS